MLELRFILWLKKCENKSMPYTQRNASYWVTMLNHN